MALATAALATASLAACADGGSGGAGSGGNSGSSGVRASLDSLNGVFREAEANVDWPDGYCADVYRRVADGGRELAGAAREEGNGQLTRDAETMVRQAEAVHGQCGLFESEEPPAQLENRYTRADMQLWRDRLAFDLDNPDNDARADRDVRPLDPAASTAPEGELRDHGTYRDCREDFCPEYSVMPTGTFRMGGTPEEHEEQDVQQYRADWESPAHEVAIGTRYGMSTHEVTRRQFRAFTEETGYAMPAGCIGFPDAPHSTDPRSSMYREGRTWEEPNIPQSEDDPVVCVSRADAQAFARWLSAKTGQTYRLPSESEWEYAARAGTESAYFWGDDIDDGCRYASGYDLSTDAATHYGFSPVAQCDDHAPYTSPVGSHEPNPWGLHDMTGNAREWVSDAWEPDLASGPTDERPRTGGTPEFPVLRGGGWNYMPQNLRIAYRSSYYNTYIHANMWGFRLVREV